MVTSASGITAPVESVTIPVILPVPICAATGLAASKQMMAPNTRRYALNLTVCSDMEVSSAIFSGLAQCSATVLEVLPSLHVDLCRVHQQTCCPDNIQR